MIPAGKAGFEIATVGKAAEVVVEVQIEGETDMRLSTIAAYVAALGGQLRLAVDLPNGQTVALDRPIEHTTPRAFGQAV